MSRANFTNDENGVTLDGVRFVTQPAPKLGACEGCSMKYRFLCTLTVDPEYQPRCQAEHRKDGRHVVWVPASRSAA